MKSLRPYAAVLSDSFHAALSSRILWCAFVAIWVLLAALSPIGYREDLTTDFRWQDFANGTKLKAMLATALVEPGAADEAAVAVAEALPADLKSLVRRVGEGEEVRIYLDRFSEAFNEMLNDQDWYDADAWDRLVLGGELRGLNGTEPGDLTESMSRRRARLRLEAAFPGVFRARSAESTLLTYAGFDFPARLAIEKRQFKLLINQIVLPTIINLLLGFVLVFLGILVTASLVPDLLQPGSLHLLLSKPVSRVGLFLTKFVGGCSFVFLCVFQLIIGLWLISWLRLDLWNPRLLWCIPVCVFLFAVFYSVSVVAGLKWRSPILSIGVTCMFGGLVFVVGLVGGLFDSFVRVPDTISSMAVAGDQLFARTRGQGLVRLDDDANRWSEIFESDSFNRNRVIAPVRVDDKSIATAEVTGGRFNAFGSGTLDLQLLSEKELWQPTPTLRLPVATTRLQAAADGRLFAMNTGGLFMSRDPVRFSTQQQSSEDSGAAGSGYLSKLMNMQGGATKDFVSILPSEVNVVSPASFIVNDLGDQVWLVSAGKLTSLVREGDDSFRLAASVTLTGDASARATLARSNDVLVVDQTDEPLQSFDTFSLETLNWTSSSGTVFESNRPSGDIDLVLGLPERRFLTVDDDQRASVWSWERSDELLMVERESQLFSNVEAVEIDSVGGRLLVAHDVDQVDWLDLTSLDVVRRDRPSVSAWRLVDRFVVTPLRTVVPQTGELGDTMSAIIAGTDTIELPGGRGGGESTVKLKILRPVLSCAGFTIVMLLIGCVYFARSDF